MPLSYMFDHQLSFLLASGHLCPLWLYGQGDMDVTQMLGGRLEHVLRLWLSSAGQRTS